MSMEKKQTREESKANGMEELNKEHLSQNGELNADEQDNVSGGSVAPGGTAFPVENCNHPRKYKTGQEREDSRFILWSQHQFEYYCPDCKKNVWIDEEP